MSDKYYQPKNFKGEPREISADEIDAMILKIANAAKSGAAEFSQLCMMMAEVYQYTHGEFLSRSYDGYMGDAKSKGVETYGGDTFIASIFSMEIARVVATLAESAGHDLGEKALIVNGCAQTLVGYMKEAEKEDKKAKRQASSMLKKVFNGRG